MPGPTSTPDIPEASALTGWAGFLFGLSLFFACVVLMACGADLFINGPRIEMLPYWFAAPMVPISGALLATLLRAAADVVRQVHRIADARDPGKVSPLPQDPAPVSAAPVDEPPPLPRG